MYSDHDQRRQHSRNGGYDRGDQSHNNGGYSQRSSGGDRSSGGSGYRQRDQRHQKQRDPSPPGPRSQGIIEKVLPGYGFIEPFDCDTLDACSSLFFHVSEVDGYIDDLRPGNCVEFEIAQDTRTGRTVGRRVVRIPDGSIQKYTCDDVLRRGTITRLPGRSSNRTFNSSSSSSSRGGKDDYSRQGKISELVSSPPPGAAQGEDTNAAGRKPPIVSFDGSGLGSEQADVGDVVEYFVQEHRQTKEKTATRIKIVEKKPRTQGRIASIKDNYGFIDLALENLELFFHFSACMRCNPHELEVGDEVELDVAKRDGKTMAQNVVLVPPGTVKFVEIDDAVVEGTVSLIQVKNPKNQNRRGHTNNNNTINNNNNIYTAKGRLDQVGNDIVSGGLISYGEGEKTNNIWFHLHDVVSAEGTEERDAMVRHADTVTFQVVKVLRTQQLRAINVTRVVTQVDPLADLETDMGVITKVNIGLGGTIRALARTELVRFNMIEVEPGVDVRQGDEVKFTPVTVQRGGDGKKGKQVMAVRISLVPRGTVKFDTIDLDVIHKGVVTVAASTQRDAFFSKNGGKDAEPAMGQIRYVPKLTSEARVDPTKGGEGAAGEKAPESSVPTEEAGNVAGDAVQSGNATAVTAAPLSVTIPFSAKDVNDLYQRNLPKVDQEVVFNIARNIHSNKEHAVNVTIVRDIGRITMLMKNPGYGFIEKGNSDKQFHFRLDDLADSDTSKYNVGTEVAFNGILEQRNGKPQARDISFISEYPVKLLDSCLGTVTKEVAVGEDGQVVQGEVEYTTKKGTRAIAAVDLSSPLQAGAFFPLDTQVRFRLSKGEPRAHLMQRAPKRLRALVKVIKQQGNFGFIDYKTDDFETVFFHFSEVEGKVRLGTGDEVEFTLTVAKDKQSDGKKATANGVKLVARAKLPEPTSTWTRKVPLSASPVVRQPYEPLANKVSAFTRPRTVDGTVVNPNSIPAAAAADDDAKTETTSTGSAATTNENAPSIQEQEAASSIVDDEDAAVEVVEEAISAVVLGMDKCGTPNVEGACEDAAP